MLKSLHCAGRQTTLLDENCQRQVFVCDCGKRMVVSKRRRTGLLTTQCSWPLGEYCSAHPAGGR
jgi:hypothetical protein